MFIIDTGHIFAGIATLESRIAIKYKRRPVKLSEQEILQCAIKSCTADEPDSTWLRAFTNGGLSPSTAYSEFTQSAFNFHLCVDDPSKPPPPISPFTKVIGMSRLPYNEAALKCHVATKGPIAVMIPAVFGNYKSGVFADPSKDCTKFASRKLNHWMVIAGYGTTFDKNLKPIDYWILRNSWGKAHNDFTL